MSIHKRILVIAFSLFFLSASAAQQTPRPLQERDFITDKLLLIQNESSGLKGAMAYLVKEVKPGSPADRAGLLPNDLILAVDMEPVYSMQELEKTLLYPMLNPGERFSVIVGRFNGTTGELEVMGKIITAR